MYHLELNLKVTFLDFTGISYYVQTGVKGHFGPKFNTWVFFQDLLRFSEIVSDDSR